MTSLAVQLSPGDVGVERTFWKRQALELAKDIVCGLDSPSNLAKAAGLNDMQWIVLQQWPAWKRLMSEVNEELDDSPELLNSDPYEAWIMKIEHITDFSELLSAEEYEAFTKEEH